MDEKFKSLTSWPGTMSGITGHFLYFSFSLVKAVSSHATIHNGSLKSIVWLAVTVTLPCLILIILKCSGLNSMFQIYRTLFAAFIDQFSG